MADQNAVQLNYDLAPSPQVASQLQQQFSQLEKNLRFKGPFGDAIKTTRDFGSELDRANQRVITLGASFAVLATSIRTLKEIAKSTIEVEKAFTEINAVFGLSARGLDQFSKQLFDAARSTGQSFERAADAAKEFSRQGLTAQETIRRTTDALVLTRLANLDVAKSVETLTASINGFQKSALTSTELVNKLATVDAKFAVSSADLAEALSRSGAAASDAGVSFDQLIGLITSAQQTTARGGAVIGNALKTIFTRVEQRGTIEAFRALGVEVEDSQGQMLKAIPLLQNFAATYDTLNDSLRKQAAQMVGGTYQINILKALLNDVAKANGAFAEATRTSAGATDEAVKRNEALNQSLDSMLAKLGVTAKQIGANIGSLSFAGPLKGLIGLVQNNPITAALEDASGKAESTGGQIAQGLIKGIGAGLLALSPLVIKAAGKVALTTFKNLSTDFSSLAGISTESQTNARVQAEIVALYRAGGAALQQQLAAMSSIAERAALVQRLLNSGASNTGSFAAVTQAVIGQGYRGRGYPRAAEGYIPFAAESAAIAAGVGGAPKGSRPVYLPTFNRGGGQRGIVANTSEFIVPGAAGGAIFNRDMIQRYGLPPGATPVAAGGHIPNAADSFGYGPPKPYGPTSSSYSVPPSYRSVEQQGPREMYGPPIAGFQKAQADQVAAARAAAQAAAEIENRQRAESFALAQKELAKREALEDKAAARKAKELAQMEAILDRENAANQKRVILTKADERNANRVLDAIHAQEAAERAEAKLLRSAQNAPIITGQRTVQEIRGIPREPYQVTNAGVITEERVYQQRMRAEQAATLAAPGLRARQAALRAVDASTATFDEFGAFGPPAPNWRQRNLPAFSQAGRRFAASRLAVPQNAAVAAAFALPFAGSLIDEGRGGTTSGVTRGVLSGGLSGAGFGASAGLLFGPLGAAIGGAGGLIAGGFIGAIKKASQSFEELATEINEANAKIQRQVEFIQSAFRLQGDISNTIQNAGSNPTKEEKAKLEAKLDELRRSRTQALLSIDSDDVRKKAISLINDPNGQSKVIELATTEQRNRAESDNLRSGVRRVFQSGGGFSGFSAQNEIDLSKILLPALKELPRDQLASVGRLNASQPGAAFSKVLASGGVNEEQIDALFKGTGGAESELIQRALQRAFSRLVRSGIIPVEEAAKKAEPVTAKFIKSLERLGVEFELESRLVEVRGAAEARVRQVRQEIAFSRDPLNEGQLIARRGEYEAINTAEQFRVQSRAASFSGRGDLLGVLTSNTTASSADSEALRDRLSRLTGQSAFEKLRDDLNTTGGLKGLPAVGTPALKTALEKQIAIFQLLSETTKENVEAIKKETQLRLDRYNELGTRAGATGEDDSLLAKAREALSRGIERNDPYDVLDQLRATLLQVDLQRDVRRGRLTPQQGASDSYEFLTNQGLTARERTSAAQSAIPLATRSGFGRRETELALIARERADAEQAAIPLGTRVGFNRRGTELGLAERERADAEQASLSVVERTKNLIRDQRLSFNAQQRAGAEQLLIPHDIKLGQLRGTRDTDRNLDQDSRSLIQALARSNPELVSGSELGDSLFGDAKRTGREGKSGESFLGGFRSSVEGAKHDLADFSDAGRDTFESLRGNATSFWQEWVTGAKQGKDAFKGFIASVASDASRMFANKAFTGLLAAIPGFGLPAGATGGEFTGKAFHFAGGGKVPAMLTGGELFIGPQTARRIGYDKLRAINGGSQHLAGGGMADVRMVRGGSGVKDDVPANLPSGSFIVKKSTAQRLGPDYFRALAGGRVQHRFLGGLLSTALGGALTGAAVGGGLGYLAGGKKGAIGGALLGGIGGGLYGWSASNAAMAASAQGSSAGLTSYVAPSLSIGAKAALGLGASAGLGLLAGGLMAPKQDSGPIGLAGVPAYRAQLEAEQMAMLSKRKANEHAFLQINPQGGYSLAGLGLEPATRRWSEGGSDVVMPTAMPSRSGGGGEPQVYIKIDVNNQGGTSSSASKNGGEPFGEGSAGRLEKVVKGWVKEEIVRQSEPDGFFSQRSRYVS